MSWASKTWNKAKNKVGALTGAAIGGTTGVTGALAGGYIGHLTDKMRAYKAKAGQLDYNAWYKANKSDIGLLRNSPSSLSRERVDSMLGAITSTKDWKTNTGVMNDVETLRGLKAQYEAEDMQREYEAAMLESYQQMAEYQGMAAEYQKQAAEAAAYQAPYQQPLAKASDAYGESAADTQNRQLMRRGLLSLTRWGDYGNQTLGVA